VASKKAKKPDAKMIGENKRAWVRTQWLGSRAVLDKFKLKQFIFNLNMKPPQM